MGRIQPVLTLSSAKDRPGAGLSAALKAALHVANRVLLYVLLTGASMVMAFPLFWMVSTSLKSQQEANTPKIIWLPSKVLFDAYQAVLTDPDFLRAYFNSIFYTTLALAGTLISIAAVAYAFSRIEWPGRDVVFFLMLSTMMIPAQALIVPQYVFFHRLDWIGTFNPLVIPGYFAGGAAMIFLLRQSMIQIPKEMDESAVIDGAGHVQIWWQIILPLVKAPLATVATFLFIGFWNNLLGPLIYTQSSELYTLPVYVSQLININNTIQPWPTIMTAAVLTTVPLIVLFFFAQRYILESVVLTGMKG